MIAKRKTLEAIFVIRSVFSRAINARRTCCPRVAVVHGRPAFRQRVSGQPRRTRHQPNPRREPDGLSSGRIDAIRPDPAFGRSRSGADVRRWLLYLLTQVAYWTS